MSKILVLMRHGHAGEAAEDYDRPLTARGQQAAAAVGQTLRAQGLQFDRVLTSSAVRAAATTASVCEALEANGGQRLNPLAQRALYLASPGDTLALLQAVPDSCQALLVVGHNPGISELAQQLLRRPLSFSPAEYVCETLALNSWSELGQ